MVSNSRMGACAKAYTGIVYTSLTQDWYYEVRQVAVAACIDGFVWEQWAAAGCMSIADPDVVTTRPSLHACYPRILLMLDQGAPHGPLGVSRLYILGLCQRSGL